MSGPNPVCLDVQGVTVRFSGLVAVNDVSFQLREREILGVIGPNGAGKTTLFNAITGGTAVQQGQIRLYGHRLENRPAEQICRLGIGRTFQLVRLFKSMTVMDNVLVGALTHIPNTHRAREKAREVIERVGLARLVQSKVTEIPLADQKKTEVARALATEPKVILLDEMMNGLTDEETGQAVELVRSLNAEGATVVVVEHVLPVIRALCHRVLVLNFGSIIAEGTPQECMNDEAVIEAYIGRRHGVVGPGADSGKGTGARGI